MATQAHCAFCFETLSAHFDHRLALSLPQVLELWDQYHTTNDQDDDINATAASPARPAAISRLLNRVGGSTQSAASSSSSLPSMRSNVSSDGQAEESGMSTPASEISQPSTSSRRQVTTEPHPLFVTWNTHARSGQKSLRGCIGTFESQALEHGLSTYALTSALEDTRFSPISVPLLPQLSNHVTLLTDFSSPVRDPLDWTLGVHGIRISFSYHGRRYGATYLPDVAKEQGWTKEETLISLMRKAGWNGSSSSWQRVWKEGSGELVRYEGKQVGLDYAEWRNWRTWVDKQGA